MTISIELDPAIEARLRAEEARLGVPPSAVVQDALNRALAADDPAALLRPGPLRHAGGRPARVGARVGSNHGEAPCRPY